MAAWFIEKRFKKKGAPQSTERVSRGRQYEAFAAAVAQGMGYRVLAKNFRLGHLEGDLLLQAPKQLLLWEVRGRSGKSYPPSQSITRRKLQNLRTLARTVHAVSRQTVRVQLFEWRGSIQSHEWRLFDIELE